MAATSLIRNARLTAPPARLRNSVLLIALSWFGATFAEPVPDPHALWQFAPPVADADVRFAVVDARPDADTRFAALTGDRPRYAYRDAQFFPTRLRVVVTHFADAFPREPADTRLVVERLDMTDSVPRPFGDGRCGADVSAVLCLAAVGIGRTIAPDRNSVTCRLVGSFRGISFDVTAKADYDKPGSAENRAAVTSVLLAATTQAIKEVRRRSESTWRTELPARRLGSDSTLRTEPAGKGLGPGFYPRCKRDGKDYCD